MPYIVWRCGLRWWAPATYTYRSRRFTSHGIHQGLPVHSGFRWNPMHSSSYQRMPLCRGVPGGRPRRAALRSMHTSRAPTRACPYPCVAMKCDMGREYCDASKCITCPRPVALVAMVAIRSILPERPDGIFGLLGHRGKSFARFVQPIMGALGAGTAELAPDPVWAPRGELAGRPRRSPRSACTCVACTRVAREALHPKQLDVMAGLAALGQVGHDLAQH